MEQSMTKTMAKYEERFQKTIENKAPAIFKKHRKTLDDDYQLKHSNLISDLDSMSESLKEQMTKDFDHSWTEYKDTQLNGQVHTAVQQIAQQSLGNIRTNSDWHDRIKQAKLDALAIIQETTTNNIRRLNNSTNEAMSQLHSTSKAKLESIEKILKDTAKTEAHEEDPTEIIKEAVNSAQTEIADLVKNSLQQIKTENGRMQKEISNLKTDLMETSELFQKEPFEAIDRYMDVHYPGTNKPVYGDPPLAQPSQVSQSSPTMSTPQQHDGFSHKEQQQQRPLIFGNHDDTLEDRWKAYDNKVAESERQQSIEARSSKVIDKLHHLHKKSSDGIIYVHRDEPPNQTQISYFYTSIVNLFNSLNIPIVQHKHLSQTSSTYPIKEPIDPKVKARVSSLLYTKLSSAVPKSWKKMRHIIESYSTTQDGYGALFSIMTNNSGYLRILRNMWGPQWTANKDAYMYLTDLCHYLSQQRRYQQIYTPFEIAAEILQQANQHDRYKVIRTTHLTTLQGVDPRGTLPPICEEQRLIDSIEANEQAPRPIPFDPTINKFRGQQRDGPKSNETNEPRTIRFQHRRSVQCTMCSTFGHNVDKDVCQIGAQIYAANQCFEKDKIATLKNFKSYSAANNKVKINNAISYFPPGTDMEEIQERLLSLAHDLMDDGPTQPNTLNPE
jgi:hypothetical protein